MRGTILAGISAGANCWYEASSTGVAYAVGPDGETPLQVRVLD